MDDHLVVAGRLLALHRIEEAGQGVEILLPPFFERMMVALSTFEADAEKRLADGPRDLFGRCGGAVEVDGADAGRGAAGGDQLAHPLIVGAIARHLRAQPAMHLERAAVAELVAIDLQNVGPPERRVIGVFGTLENLVDPALAFLGIGIGEESADLIRPRQRAERVDIDASQEDGVAGQLGRHDAHRLELGPGVIVDLVVDGHGRVRVRRAGPRHLQAHDGNLSHVLHRDGRLAWDAAGVSPAAAIDRGDMPRVAGIGRGGGHVALAAVGEDRRGQDLLVRLEAQNALGGTGVERDKPWRVGGPDRRALLEPFVENLDAPAAAMGNRPGRLEQQQALRRRRGENAPATRLLDKGVVIRHRIEAEDGELETVLPRRLAVTAAAVAAELGEEWRDIVYEMKRTVGLVQTHVAGRRGAGFRGRGQRHPKQDRQDPR